MLESPLVPFSIDVDNPEIPKVVFGNLQTQRADYTDVLLMTLLIQVEKLTEQVAKFTQPGELIQAEAIEQDYTELVDQVADAVEKRLKPAEPAAKKKPAATAKGEGAEAAG
ncbi:MAG TPA: hypothetical protein V6D07_19015 [Trichocoleus sp.]